MTLRDLTDEQLAARALAVTERINRAYWTFTRTARGAPPSVTVPDAYDERRAIHAEMRERQRAKRAEVRAM
jgi:hypothetical protein